MYGHAFFGQAFFGQAFFGVGGAGVAAAPRKKRGSQPSCSKPIPKNLINLCKMLKQTGVI